MPGSHNEIEKRLWDAADELRANSVLKSSEYSVPVLGLIFLRYADHKFSQVEKELAEKSTGRRKIGKTDYQARGVMYLPEKARFSTLLNLPEGADIGKAINAAMKAIEDENEDLKGVLPRNYAAFENDLLFTLLKNFASIPIDIEGDVFGKIYEYFLGKFAMAEGSKGGEFFTPTSLVRLIVEVIEPFHGRIFDPADGSGGMFVQSARFVQSHAKRDSLTSGPSPTRTGSLPSPSYPSPIGRGKGESQGEGAEHEGVGVPADMISIYGQDRVAETVRLCKMNLAVHGLSGDIREGNTYYEDIHESVGKFDFVMANPPFNVDKVDKERLANDPRFPYGLPKPDNANYLWIQIFYSALNPKGRSGFVMANSASDARGSEMEIRRKLIEAGVVDVMIAISSNFFYTVTLPCTLYFLDRGKVKTARKDKVLFVDARHIYKQIDRAHREFSSDQMGFLANIVRLYRSEESDFTLGGDEVKQKLLEVFGESASSNRKSKIENLKYRDVPGLCKVATLKEIEAQGWSLNPGRYVGVSERPPDDFDFKEKLEGLNEELETLNVQARELEETIARNVAEILEV